MAVRSGLIDEFDAVDDLCGKTKIVQAVSVPEAEKLLPTVNGILDHGGEMGLVAIEVHGPRLVIKVVDGYQEEARRKLSELQLIAEVA